MEIQLGEYRVSDDLSLVDFETVHGWLTGSYWSLGVAREKVERAARGSALVIGAYLGSEQAGYARIVSDKTTFAWLCDVFVGEAHRGNGLARGMVLFAMDHPELQGLRRWLLATKDAHEIYRSCGFEELPQPERWMVKLP